MSSKAGDPMTALAMEAGEPHAEPNEPPDPHRDLAAAWAAVPIATVALHLAETYLAPLLPHENPADAARLFLDAQVPICRPERLEHLRYLIAIICAPVGFTAGFLAVRRLPLPRLVGAALVGQCLLLLAFMYARHSERVAYFTPTVSAWADALTLGLCIVIARYGITPIHNFAASLHISQRLGTMIALIVTVAFLSPFIVRDAEAYLGPEVIWEHMEYTTGEYFAIAKGKTPLVNFYPQYNNLLPLVLSPLFRVTGYTFLAFSSLMVALSLIALMAVFSTLSMVTRRPIAALALYLPILGLSFMYRGAPAWALGAFNYYAVWPMRYVLPLICLATVVWAIVRPTLWRWALAGMVAAFSALNNLDFGGPAFASALAAIVLARPHRIWRALLSFFLGAIVACGVVQVGLFLRSGAFPDFTQLTTFSKIFGLYGFAMIPLPGAGMHWTVYFAYMACLFAAVVSWWRGTRDSAYAGALAFVAVFGCGSFMYFIGRSHPDVLVAIYFTWSLAIMLLMFGFVRYFASAWSLGSWHLAIIPGLLLLSHAFVFAVLLGVNSQPISAQFARRVLHDAAGEKQRRELVAFIHRNVQPSARTVLMLPRGHQIAAQERVRNEFPFPHPGSIILKAQAQRVEDVIVGKKIKTVFISEKFDDAEQRERFQRLGFQLKESFGGVNLWTRNARSAGAL